MFQAATEYFNQAMADLPNNRDVALQTSKKALDLFDQVIREAPHDSPLARPRHSAGRGSWRCATTCPRRSNNTSCVAKEWPDSPEAAEAKRYAEALKDPQAVAFYKELYDYSPTAVTLPPEGTATFPPSGLGSSLSGGLLNPDPASKTPSDKPPTLPRDTAIPGMREVVGPKAVSPSPAVRPRPSSGRQARRPPSPRPPSRPQRRRPVLRPTRPRPAEAGRNTEGPAAPTSFAPKPKDPK